MTAADYISHKGIVKEIKAHSLIVSIITTSGCASCEIKGVCNASEMTEKEVEVAIDNANDYKLHQAVTVAMKKNMGLQAVWWGYLLPFLLVLGSLIGISVVTDNQGLAGLISLALLIPYYIILYYSRSRMKNKFNFFLIEE